MPRWRRNPHVIATELDGETVLLDSSTRDLYTLNATGQVVWATVDAGLDAVVAHLASEFAVAPEAARADALELIGELVESGLLVATT